MSPSTSIWVTTTASAPASASRGERVGPVDARALGPAPHRDLAAPHVEADGDRAGRPAIVGHEVRVLERGGAHHDAGDADVGQGARPPRRAHAAAGLHRARRPPRRWRRSGARLTGSPVRAASRSTVWIHGAPAATKRLGHRDRVVAVDALAVEVALDELHDPARRAGRSPGRGPSGGDGGRGALDERRSTARPVRLDFSGWNCVAHTWPALDGGHHRAAVVAGGADDGVVGVGRVGVDEVGPRRIGRAGEQRGGRPGARAGSTASAGASRRRAGGAPCRAARRGRRRPGAPRTPRRAAACRCRCRGTARPRSTASRATSSRPVAAQRLHARARRRRRRAAPRRRPRGSRPGSAVRRASAPTCCERLLGRAQVADPVVEDGDEGHRAQTTPLVDGTPPPSTRTASRRQRATPLKRPRRCGACCGPRAGARAA